MAIAQASLDAHGKTLLGIKNCISKVDDYCQKAKEEFNEFGVQLVDQFNELNNRFDNQQFNLESIITIILKKLLTALKLDTEWTKGVSFKFTKHDLAIGTLMDYCKVIIEDVKHTNKSLSRINFELSELNKLKLFSNNYFDCVNTGQRYEC